MSIATRKGDAGMTALMYNRRVSKTHPRVAAYGTVDELNAALGAARARAGAEPDAGVADPLLGIQKDLVTLMGELATLEEDLARYEREGYSRVTPGMTSALDDLVRRLEDRKVSFKGWATPGATPLAAALDVARTICRRAERGVCGLQETGQLHNPEIIVYLNRLSDVLWLMARWAEDFVGQEPDSCVE
jgi:cob(I)alamin adenosyltransferase